MRIDSKCTILLLKEEDGAPWRLAVFIAAELVEWVEFHANMLQ